MKKIHLRQQVRELLADMLTPVGIYLKLRDHFPHSFLLESSDYHGQENSFSFICLEPIAFFRMAAGELTQQFPNEDPRRLTPPTPESVPELLNNFLQFFHYDQANNPLNMNGVFGYNSFDAIRYFERIAVKDGSQAPNYIPEIQYHFFRFLIAIDHFQNRLLLIENLLEGEQSRSDQIINLLQSRNFSAYPFRTHGTEESPITDEDFKALVRKAKHHCRRGDVFQVVFSRPFQQSFRGDDFNVYRALRSINPSPYLFYFDYGGFRLFGSSPEAQLVVKEGKATIHPIAGTFRRSGDDATDQQLAKALSEDHKENAEHIMLVDLARNDLSRNADQVTVEVFKEVQFYSHVIHLVSKVSGTLKPRTHTVRVLADSFPAGTLSGAPKYRALELIRDYEQQNRSYYGGSIGYLGFDGTCNQAILIRSFLSKDNTLHYQAGAGLVDDSQEESETEEVGNKMAALRRAIVQAEEI
ncbi:MAG: anthranilate synthase component I family protein [Bernardetiaceae bacterium]